MDIPSPYITLDEVRQLVRSGRSGTLPDHVGRTLRGRQILVLASEAAEIAEIVGGLTRQAREKLNQEGLEPPAPNAEVQEKIGKRDRDRLENLAVLLAIEGITLATAGSNEALARGEECIAWGRLAGSAVLEAEGWRALAQINGILFRLAELFEAQRSALEAAQRSSNPCLIIEALSELAVVFVMRGRPSEAEECINEATPLIELLDEADGARYRTKILMTLGRIATLRRSGEVMLTNYHEALRIVEKERDPLTYMGILSDLGSAYSTYGDEQRNIECQRQMIAIAEQYGDLVAVSWGHYRIGEGFFRLDDNEQAEKAFDLSLRFAPPHSTQPRLYIAFKRAEICSREGRTEEGLEHCRTILDTITEQGAPMLTVMTWLQIGLLEQGQGCFEAAERAYRQTIDIGGRYESIDRTANAQVHLAAVLIALERENEAEEMVREVLGMDVRNIGDEMIVADACRVLSEITERQGNLHEALHYSRELNEHQRSIAERKTEESVQKARVLAEVERLEREVTLEREQRRRAEQELAQAVLALSGKNELLEKVEHQLHRALAGIATEKAREITHSLRSALLQIDAVPADGDHPIGYLQTISPDFLPKLRAHYPDLTHKQERLCGLIRAGLTSQEIATVLGVGYEGLRAQRKRLRRKLGLDAEVNLERLIGSI